MPERFTLPPTVTGSRWRNVIASLARSVRGMGQASDGTPAPVVTNREAVAVIAALRKAAANVSPWALWYQFAALAYGWSPTSPTLDTSDEHADDDYDLDAAAMLVQQAGLLADQLDAANTPEPALYLEDTWQSAGWLADVAQALDDDGANVQFKIPLPACKDPVTGKPAKPVKDPKTGRWTCPGGVVTIDDPITAIVKALAPIAIPVALGLIAYGAFTQRRKRRRRRT